MSYQQQQPVDYPHLLLASSLDGDTCPCFCSLPTALFSAALVGLWWACFMLILALPMSQLFMEPHYDLPFFCFVQALTFLAILCALLAGRYSPGLPAARPVRVENHRVAADGQCWRRAAVRGGVAQ